MKRIKDIQDLRDIQLGILRYVHDTCERNGLAYFLCAGTLLGAVRHKGYIPWDDDIDIMMPRKDYERLLKLVAADKGSPFSVFTYRNCPEYGRAFAKISDSRTVFIQKEQYRVKNLGVNIDVFPYDGLPASKDKITSAFNKTSALRRYLNMLTRNTGSITKRMPKWRFPFVFLLCLYLDFIAKRHSADKSEKVTCFTAVLIGKTEIIERAVLEERILADFENEQSYILKRYHEYLTNHFGDYMKLPPISHRRNTHGVMAWRR